MRKGECMVSVVAAGLLLGAALAQGGPPPPTGAVATVNGRAITEKELIRFLALRHGRVAVQQLVTTRVVMAELKRQGLEVTSADVERHLAERIARRGGEAAFSQDLRRRGVTLDYLKTYELRPEAALRKLAERLRLEGASDKELVALLVSLYGPQTERQLVMMYLLRRELERQALTVSEAEIDKRLADRIARQGGEAASDAMLRRAGITRDYVKTYQLMPEIALAKLADKLKDRITADAGLVEAFGRRFGPQAPAQLALHDLITQELKRRALSVTEADLDARLAERIARGGGEEAFDEALRRRGLTRDAFTKYDLVPEVGGRKLTEAIKAEVVDRDEFVAVLVARFGRQAAQQLVMTRLLNQELRRHGLSVTGAEIGALLAKRIEERGGEEAYLAHLRRTRVTLDYVKAYELTTEIALTKLADRSETPITADEAVVDLLIKRHGRQGVQQLIMIELVNQELARQGRGVADADVAALLAKRLEEAGGEDAYQERLRRAGFTLDYVKQYELPAAVAQRQLVEASVSVTDQEVRELFEANYLEKRQVRRIVLANVLVANDVLKQLSGGADFTDLVRQHSIDPRARQDGGLGAPFGRGGLLPQVRHLEEVAFTLKIGEHSGVIEVAPNFYIIKLERIIPPRSDIAVEQVREQLREVIWQRKLTAASRAALAELRRKAQVVVRTDLAGGQPADG